ncbi:MAG: Mu transposase C-terminal domain-containing protein [Pseudomonadota bacterium]
MTLNLNQTVPVFLNDNKLHYVGPGPDGEVFRPANGSGPLQVLRLDEIDELVRTEAMVFAPSASLAAPTENGLSEEDQVLLQNLPASEARAVEERLAQCLGFHNEREAKASGPIEERLHVADRCFKAVADVVHAFARDFLRRGLTPRAGSHDPGLFTPLSPSRLRKWYTRWVRAGKALIGLVSRRTLRVLTRPHFDEERERFVQLVARYWLSRKKPSVTKAIKDAKNQAEKEDAGRLPGQQLYSIPSDSHIRRRLRLLDTFVVDWARLGADAAMRKHASSTPQDKPLFAGEEIETDTCELDLKSFLHDAQILQRMTPNQIAKLDQVRLKLTIAVCKATNYVLGLHLGPIASSSQTIRCLHLCTLDKTPFAQAVGCRYDWRGATPLFTVKADAGTENTAFQTVQAISVAGGRLVVPPAGVPRLRGTIERIFKIIATALLTELSGRTFNSPAERGDYNAEAEAVHSTDDVVRILIRYIVDIYHQTPSAALRGRTPAEEWDRLTRLYGASPPVGPRTRRLAFGLPMRRVPSREGVRIQGLQYNNKSLQRATRGHRGEVVVYVDPLDLGAVTVVVGRESIHVSAPSSSFRGVTLDEWRDAQKLLQQTVAASQRVDLTAIREALEAIRQQDTDARRRRGLTCDGIDLEQARRLESKLYAGLQVDSTVSEPVAETSLLDVLGGAENCIPDVSDETPPGFEDLEAPSTDLTAYDPDGEWT